MFALERQQNILQYIHQKGKASVTELSQIFGVTKITIRRDLEDLAEKGLVIKIHGGALSSDNSLTQEVPYVNKSEIRIREKRQIGASAAHLINEGDVVIIDSGSTTLEVARNINTTGIVIITNDLKVAMELAPKPGIKLVVTGGILQQGLFTLIGANAEEFFSNIHVNKTFLGADAISTKYGITNRTIEEVPLKRLMVKAAEEVLVVADHTKFNKKVFATVCPVQQVNRIVTDTVDPDYKQALGELGVEIVTTK